MYRHLFWDLGGTLVNTYPALDETLAGVVRRHGHDVDVEHVSRLTRLSTGEAMRALGEEFGIDTDEFVQANESLKRNWETQPPPVMPGAKQLMADVHDAGGLNLVVTHRDRRSAESLLEVLEISVDDLVSASDGYPRKPSPEMASALLQRHDLDPATCLAVGDRPIDAEAAKAAGIDAALLTSPFAEVSDVARHTISSLDELRPLLGLD